MSPRSVASASRPRYTFEEGVELASGLQARGFDLSDVVTRLVTPDLFRLIGISAVVHGRLDAPVEYRDGPAIRLISDRTGMLRQIPRGWEALEGTSAIISTTLEPWVDRGRFEACVAEDCTTVAASD